MPSGCDQSRCLEGQPDCPAVRCGCLIHSDDICMRQGARGAMTAGTRPPGTAGKRRRRQPAMVAAQELQVATGAHSPPSCAAHASNRPYACVGPVHWVGNAELGLAAALRCCSDVRSGPLTRRSAPPPTQYPASAPQHGAPGYGGPGYGAPPVRSCLTSGSLQHLQPAPSTDS